MTTRGEYDCIVIGAGVQGSFTAYQLAKRNQKTLLLEQVRHAGSFRQLRCQRGFSLTVTSKFELLLF